MIDTRAYELLLKKRLTILAQLDQVEEDIRKVENRAYFELTSLGKTVNGFKLKPGSVRRKVVNKEVLAQDLLLAGFREEDIYKRDLVGVIALGKLTKDTEFDLDRHLSSQKTEATVVYTG